MSKVFIIAEAGINHNGSFKTAKKMVDAAFAAGADAIKFQTFNAEAEISKFAYKADYQKKTAGDNESLLEMTKKLELSKNDFRRLFNYCKKKGIAFLSTPSDIESINLLNELGLKIFKIPSGELTDLPYLKKIGGLRKKVILSTGMSTLEEIGHAVAILLQAGMKINDLTILHCNTEYPTPLGDVNLKAMLAIKNMFKTSVGYSDHTLGIDVPVAAVALGAKILEKHFTLDRNMPGPDHKASLEPNELKAMVAAVRNTEKCLGNGIKRPMPSELKNRIIARKSIVAAIGIKKGELFSAINITTKRPANGISPMKWDTIIGKKAKRDFTKDEAIEI